MWKSHQINQIPVEFAQKKRKCQHLLDHCTGLELSFLVSSINIHKKIPLC